jgi:E3 ubiquitin-protein ligase HERC1
MLSQMIHSLLLLPVHTIRGLLPELLMLLAQLDKVNRLLPAAAVLEEQEMEWPVHGKLLVKFMYMFRLLTSWNHP